MTCKETKGLLNAYVDGQLDSAGSLAVETHMRGCSSCLTAVENLHRLASAIKSPDLRFEAPAHLKRQVQRSIRAAHLESRSSVFYWRWATALASAVLLVALTWTASTRWTRSSEDPLANEIVSSHVRSMMLNHSTDVLSSDSHTVKPWFGGKLNYSPPTKDFAEQGFRLVGGRLDYVDKHPVAALVYQRRLHIINLFVWPSNDGATTGEERLSRQGYNLIHWSQAGMTYWLVSDLNSMELGDCARLLKE